MAAPSTRVSGWPAFAAFGALVAVAIAAPTEPGGPGLLALGAAAGIGAAHALARTETRTQLVLAAVIVAWFAGLAAGALAAGRLGAAQGLAASTICVPCVVALAASVRGVGEARAGSVVDRACRRRVWLVAAIGIGFAALLVPHVLLSPHLGAPSLAAAAAVGVAVATLALDAAALANASWRGSRRGVVDYGVVGDEVVVEAAPAPASYRTSHAVENLRRGSRAVAVTRLRRALVLDALALVALIVLGRSLPPNSSPHRFVRDTACRAVTPRERAPARPSDLGAGSARSDDRAQAEPGPP